MMAWEAARQEAANIADRFGTSDPYDIARELGIEVYQAAMPDGSSGMIIKRTGEDAEIFVEADDVRARQRFTVAHELGHFVERTNIAGDEDFSFRDRRGKKYDIHEFFADEFAGALLMPESRFLELERKGLSTTDLAGHFGVSANAVEMRRTRLRKNPSRA